MAMIFNRLMILFITSMPLMFLPACTLPPTPSTDEQSFPKTTRSGMKIIHHQYDFSGVKWWKRMHDPLLNHLIREALLHNNQIKIAQANILKAQAQLKEARFSWFPTLKAAGNGFIGGGWDTEFTPHGPLAQSPALSQLGSIHFHGYFSGFVPSYSLNILENIHKNQFANASLAMQRASYFSTRLSIISQITGAYFMLLGQKEQLNEETQLIRDLKKAHQLEWIRFKEGASDFSQVTHLDQDIMNHQANRASIKNSISQIENSIQTLLNHHPGPIVKPGTILQLSLQGLIPAYLPSSVLQHHPDLMIAQENLKMSKHQVGIAYSNFFPMISLTGALGSSSIDLSHLLTLNTGLWVAQAAASIPILNGIAYEQIQEAKAGYDAAYFTYVQTLQTIFANVDNSLTNQQRMNQIYNDQYKAFLAAKKTLALAFAKYREGAKDYREVAKNQLMVDRARLDLNFAKMQQLDSIVQVYQALAGGYQ